MKIKLFLKVFSYTFGTVLLVILGIIVATNFVKDGRAFEKPIVAVAKDKSVKPIPSVTVKKSTKSSSVNSSSSSKKDTIEKAIQLKVEIINYSGFEQVGKDIKATLEANDFVVVLKNGALIKGSTIITDRSDRKAGEKVQEIIKAGTVNVEIQKEPYFDAIIELGSDFAP